MFEPLGGGASSYLALLAICGFLRAAWMVSKIAKVTGVSSIAPLIAVGVILGPQVMGIISKEYAVCNSLTHTECVPDDKFMDNLDKGLPLRPDLGHIVYGDYCRRSDYKRQVKGIQQIHASIAIDDEDDEGHVGDAGDLEDRPRIAATGHAGSHRRLAPGGGEYKSYEECLQKNCEAEVSRQCGLAPDVFTLIGHCGVALMIFESGMQFDIEKVRVVGPKACAVAVVGTVLPLFTGTLLMVAFGKPLVPDAISVGAALAPSSIGIAVRLLGESGVLQLDIGQAIITTAFVDDILSLVVFNVLFSLRGGLKVRATVVNPIIGVAFVGIAMVLAVKFWPRAINEYIMPRLPVRPGERKVTIKDQALFIMMIFLLIAYATATHFLGTHLWGCFIAGVSFAGVDEAKQKGHAHHVWVRQTKTITSWMVRLFFACTVAFSIPVQKLLSLEAFWKGTIMGIGPCVLTKVFCAPFMGRARFVIGWAMVGRAEFAYLIAQMAASANMMDVETLSIALWALLYATILAPIVFRCVLNRYMAAEGIKGTEDPNHASCDLSDEEDDIFLENSACAKKPDTHAESSLYGAALADLDSVTLDPEGMQKKECTGSWPPVHEKMEDLPSASPPRKLRLQLWCGRQLEEKPQSSDHWVCCLFFKSLVEA